MRRLWVCGWALALMTGMPGVALAAGGDGPSFDCAKATSSAEQLVCRDAKLAAMDRETARLYRLASADPALTPDQAALLRGVQRGWIKGRDDCWKADDLRACVAASYAERVHQLRQGSKAARVAAPDAASRGPYAYRCEGLGALLGVTFLTAGDGAAYLQWKDRGVGLLQAPAASGARYAGSSFDGAWSFWIKGDGAQLTGPDGKAMACQGEPTG